MRKVSVDQDSINIEQECLLIISGDRMSHASFNFFGLKSSVMGGSQLCCLKRKYLRKSRFFLLSFGKL